MSDADKVLILESRLKRVLLKAARKAELDSGLVTTNGLRKGSMVVCSANGEVLEIMNTIKSLRSKGMDANNETVKALKHKLRRLQRLSVFHRNRDDSLKLDSMLHQDRGSFWRKISKFKRLKNKNGVVISEKPTLSKFANFYEKLFSHDDRPSSNFHMIIESEVKCLFQNLEDKKFDDIFSLSEIHDAVEGLKVGKTKGFDSLSNEFYKFGSSYSLLRVLLKFFNASYSLGVLPSNFNTSVLIPIPKKDKLLAPSDYRPISISTPIATLLESLLLRKMPCLENISNNQFGYKKNTSCKNAFFIANEAIGHYESAGSNMHVISLDAAKAFDKMWREGLFYKLRNVVDPGIWRLLVYYYNFSYVIVNVDGKCSSCFMTTQGVKQGGILSPFLFNYFMNDLITSCLDLNVGALTGESNVSCLAYCDDLLLLSPVKTHMDFLLKTCMRFADDWKVKFNPDKSISYSLFRPKGASFEVNDMSIPATDLGFIYLGMPIGIHKFVVEHFNKKFASVERAFYSLRGIGCSVGMLPPKSMAFIYKTYCQSICKYGMECLYIDDKSLGVLNVRQNILIKYALGLDSRCRTKPLLQCLSVDQIGQLYQKHKLIGIKQVFKNVLSANVFEWLKSSFTGSNKPSKRSIFFQIDNLNSFTGKEILSSNFTIVKSLINSNFCCNDDDLVDVVAHHLGCYINENWFTASKALKNVLSVI